MVSQMISKGLYSLVFLSGGKHLEVTPAPNLCLKLGHFGQLTEFGGQCEVCMTTY